MQRTPQVYLDSSDFSLLSDPRRLDEKTITLRDELQSYADNSLAQFRFSMVHVCEVAPTGPHAQEAAERRADLIYRLCGSNTLVTIDEIREAEIAGSEDFSPYSVGRWYPPLDDLLPESPWPAMKKMLTEDLKAIGMSRQQRREKEREVFRKGGLTKNARKLMEAALPSTARDLLAILPLHPQELDALMTYLRGGQGRNLAIEACHRVLANPTWVMGRFAADPDKMEGVTAWLRQGGSDFVERMNVAISNAHNFYRCKRERDALRQAEISKIDDPEIQAAQAKAHLLDQQSLESMMARTRNEMEESILRQCVSENKERPSDGTLPLDNMRARYPGIAASVAAGIHATRRAFEEVQPRTLKASDFGDAMHAFYAPYVDIFRTDTFMADPVTKVLTARRTRVARRLADVPTLIRQCLINGSTE